MKWGAGGGNRAFYVSSETICSKLGVNRERRGWGLLWALRIFTREIALRIGKTEHGDSPYAVSRKNRVTGQRNADWCVCNAEKARYRNATAGRATRAHGKPEKPRYGAA
ncbi:hypothetical protein DVH26_28935 [Paenibacillus sp. H1-7]|nr:hypothetical protein DVH26_28935 [Paenibacillus sp. H1-7]